MFCSYSFKVWPLPPFLTLLTLLVEAGREEFGEKTSDGCLCCWQIRIWCQSTYVQGYEHFRFFTDVYAADKIHMISKCICARSWTFQIFYYQSHLISYQYGPNMYMNNEFSSIFVKDLWLTSDHYTHLEYSIVVYRIFYTHLEYSLLQKWWNGKIILI